MKFTKRQQNSILIHVFFYTIMLIVLIYFTFSYFYPKVISIETTKKTTKQLYESLKGIEKSGITFEEFQTLNQSIEKSAYITEVLKNIDKVFYDENLKNSEDPSFMSFLENKKIEINSLESQNILEQREKKIVHILPSYSDTSNIIDESALTDFKFINYIESVIETFGMSHSDSIGIKKLELLDDFISQDEKQNSLETNLFAIPVKLNIVGKKTGVIDFLHYIENVGKIFIDEKDIKLYEDKFLYKNGRKIVLEGDNYKPTYSGIKDYNIYENQIVDIALVKLEDYIDDSSLYRKEKDFIEFIKETQGDEKIEMEVRLNFYVKGVPNYKLRNFIEGVLQKHTDLITQVNKKLEDTSIAPHITNKLTKINNYLKEVSKDIVTMKKSLRKGDNLEELYRAAVEYDTAFTTYEKQLTE